MSLALAVLLSMPALTAFAAEITVTVDTAADDNGKQGCTAAADDCSLRGAITKANGDAANSYSINIPAGHYTLTLAGANEDANATGDLDITRSVTLTGADIFSTTIDANKIDRVFEVRNGASATFAALDIIQGQPPGSSNGGGIHNIGSSVTLSYVLVMSNTATNGGGIYNAGSSASISVPLLSGIFSNKATADGGGLYNQDGKADFEFGYFWANEAARDGGGLYNKGGKVRTELGYFADNEAARNGGGLVNDGVGSFVDIKEFSYIFGNSAKGAIGGGGMLNLGGSIALTTGLVFDNDASSGDGGGLLNIAGRATISNSWVYSNSADSDGGGIDNDRGQVTLASVLIYGNSAEWGGGILNDGAFGSAVVTLTDGSGVMANRANSDGGGIYNVEAQTTISDTWMYSNTATLGGGIYNESGQTTFTAGLLTQNRGQNNGGGIYQEGGAVTVNDSCIVGNSATAVYVEGGTTPLNAKMNWWGAANGPSPGGSGDTISGNVDGSSFLATSGDRCTTIGGTVTGLLGDGLQLGLLVAGQLDLVAIDLLNVENDGPYTFNVILPTDIERFESPFVQSADRSSRTEGRVSDPFYQATRGALRVADDQTGQARRHPPGFEQFFQEETKAEADWLYAVLVAAQPTNPDQRCEIVNSTGILNSADITDINVTCTTEVYLPLIVR